MTDFPQSAPLALSSLPSGESDPSVTPDLGGADTRDPAQVSRQYYYRVNECNAVGPKSPDCICWHDEGTGPLADGTATNWRDKPSSRSPAAPAQQSTGNDCSCARAGFPGSCDNCDANSGPIKFWRERALEAEAQVARLTMTPQQRLDASVTPEQAAESVRWERDALANRDKQYPQPDGFINDYD